MARATQAVHRFLTYLGLCDRDAHISVTQVALYTVLGRALVAPSWPLVTALACASILSAHRLYESGKADARVAQSNETQALAKRVAELAAVQADVATMAGETKKQHEEMKRILSSSTLVNAFKPPVRRSQAASNVITG